jgi:hypothetical protein
MGIDKTKMWVAALINQSEWGAVLSSGLCTWNCRGLMVAKRHIQELKLNTVCKLLDQNGLVFLQEPHLNYGTHSAFCDWARRKCVYHFSRPTTSLQDGVMICSYNNLDLEWDIFWDDKTYSYGIMQHKFLHLWIVVVHLDPRKASIRRGQFKDINAKLLSLVQERKEQLAACYDRTARSILSWGGHSRRF